MRMQGGNNNGKKTDNQGHGRNQTEDSSEERHTE